ncbi:MAG: hypothetical protein HYU66_01265 [Armatimonadetes bacterium]|nr:hypothetical protein [Armatimonadota bacterium]
MLTALCPRRGQTLLEHAIVIGAVATVVLAIAVAVGRSGEPEQSPVPPGTRLQDPRTVFGAGGLISNGSSPSPSAPSSTEPVTPPAETDSPTSAPGGSQPPAATPGATESWSGAGLDTGPPASGPAPPAAEPAGESPPPLPGGPGNISHFSTD